MSDQSPLGGRRKTQQDIRKIKVIGKIKKEYERGRFKDRKGMIQVVDYEIMYEQYSKYGIPKAFGYPSLTSNY